MSVAAQIQQISLAVECDDPGTCTDAGSRMSVNTQAIRELPAFTGQAASFNAQARSTLAINYQDVGKVRLHARVTTAQGATIRGMSNLFVVRPASIAVDVSNPLSYDPGIFAKAGDPLVVLLSARTSAGVIAPNFGRESSAQRLSLKEEGQATVPANAVNGAVATHNAFALIGAGIFASTDVRYSEAGTARFVAQIQSGDYLGAGPVESPSSSIGRFIPWAYESRYESYDPVCRSDDGAFTYLGQPFVLRAALIAHNRDGERLINYPDVGPGVGIKLLAADLEIGTPLTERIDRPFRSLDWHRGEGWLRAGETAINRLADADAADGPFRAAQFALTVDMGSAGEAIYGRLSNADFSDAQPDCVGQGCYARKIGLPGAYFYGRLMLDETYGSEFDDLPIRSEAEYFNGERFVVNHLDHCTLADPGLLEIVENPEGLDTTVLGTVFNLLKGASVPGLLQLRAPGETGSVLLQYGASPWLKGVSGEDPSAHVVFGRYGGHDRVISWQEVY